MFYTMNIILEVLASKVTTGKIINRMTEQEEAILLVLEIKLYLQKIHESLETKYDDQ